MSNANIASIESVAKTTERKDSKWGATWREYKKSKYLFFMLIPVLIWYAIFHYGPLYGVLLAFKDFSPRLGILNSPWIGLDHFKFLFFQSPDFMRIFRNTVLISCYHMIFGFPAPIILALLLNELRLGWFKRIAQTISYLPHFFSWVVLSGVVIVMLSPSEGPVNFLLKLVNIEPIYFLADTDYFRSTLVGTGIWKEIGWGTIIYLAALSGIDPALYEAAVIDGANRIKQIWYITLPSILPVITILFILSLGGILNAGFDQIFNLYNPAVYEVADIIDTYVYRVGILGAQFGLTTAVGLFKNVIGIALVLGTNYVVKKMGQEGVL
ncbi:ABC transporter permease [Paenibacillus prosopidis]|uniref:Putative aldouronate transport system permease protein n=1 Tax=Paenibacillus prosopidis TaxID=630520 RepID=A0A368VTU5_9BACL|nr:ABC transporter permease subunit [Paenibacillus prosopidis]RCW45454.1 putative aldouronate transport system permease protein [Paenibacillus prosopidis]